MAMAVLLQMKLNTNRNRVMMHVCMNCLLGCGDEERLSITVLSLIFKSFVGEWYQPLSPPHALADAW
jgi:hypothetical protein